MNKKNMQNSGLLFLAACIWGASFVSQSKGMEYMGPITFNAARFTIGFLVLLPVILIRRKKEGAGRQPIPWKVTLIGGGLCGAALLVASTFQQFGIVYTTVGKAGFITTLYIIFVPIIGVFIGKKVSGIVWLGAIFAAMGMYLLCMTESLQINPGDVLVLICAVVFSLHILVIDYFSPKADGVMLSCIQFLICGIISTIGAFVLEQPSLMQLKEGIGSIIYAGAFSCGIAYTLQIVGQKDMNPTVAALILSLESVVSVIAGWIAFKIGFLTVDQSLNIQQIVGCIIVFGAVILVQLPGKQKETQQQKIVSE